MDLLSLLGGLGGTDTSIPGADTGGGDGLSGGLSSLLQNKLFLQYLAGAGQDLSEGKPIGTNVNKITQQNISAQNYAKLMDKALGSDDTKMTLSNKGINLSIPTSELKGGSFLGDNPLSQNPVQNTTVQPITSTSTTPSQLGTVNPFVGSQLGNLSASDLAGLSPQEISSVFSTAMNVENLKQKRISDIADSLYKQKQMEHIDSQIRKEGREKIDPLEQEFPISVPGLGRVTNRQWSSLPDKDKQYALFVSKAKQLGDGDIMSKEEYGAYLESMKPNERVQFLNELIKNPKLMSVEKSLRQAGATNISLDSKLTEKKAMSELSGQLYFNDPKWTGEIDKHMKEVDIQAKGKAGSQEFKDNYRKAKMKEKIGFIEGKIVGGGGTIDKVRKEGKIGIWTVKWPSGDTKEIKYALDE